MRKVLVLQLCNYIENYIVTLFEGFFDNFTLLNIL